MLQLGGKFPDWSVGFDWDRREDVAKRLRHGVTGYELIRKGLILPDILIHRVGKRENLLVVGVKKASNTDYDGDIWKLEGMTLTHLALPIRSSSERDEAMIHCAFRSNGTNIWDAAASKNDCSRARRGFMAQSLRAYQELR